MSWLISSLNYLGRIITPVVEYFVENELRDHEDHVCGSEVRTS
jgi:hypothetical protein